jgi:hypothetical protein
MANRWLGVFAALAIVGGSFGCSSSSTPSTVTPTDSGADTKADSAHPDSTPSDTGGDAGDPNQNGPNTTGNTCTTNDQCDPDGSFGSQCIPFDKNVSVCILTSCDSTNDYSPCDHSKGYCEATSTGSAQGICVGGCDFGMDGTYSRSCPTGVACVNSGYIALNTDGTWKSGIGTCEGGTCTADTDCAASAPKCQKETMNCVSASNYHTYTKNPGDACTRPASGSSTDCLCWAEAGKPGYCASICTIGGAACATGLNCMALLPKTTDTGAPAWTTEPTGMQGYCLKPCTQDTDCSSITGGAYCETSVVGGGFCEPGTRPAG